jgi:ferritin
MIKTIVEDSLNLQVQKEMYSANLYLSMSSYFQSVNLIGFANWMRIQYQEESAHAMKFFDYIISRNGEALLKDIKQPEHKWNSALEVFEAAYKHEQYITQSIDEIAALALQEKDFATYNFLQWFINEQTEEEANVNEIVERIKMAEGSKGSMFMLDTEMKARVFVAPPANNAQASV